MFKTMNSAFGEVSSSTLESGVTDPVDALSTMAEALDEISDELSVENIIQGLSSDRLFFEAGETNSIMQEAHKPSSENEYFPKFKERSVVQPMESQNPYLDFKKSMQEMVQALGLKDWESLEELLGCYLKVNGKNNHGYIIGAFIDLLAGLNFAIPANCSCFDSFVASPSSPLSFTSSASPSNLSTSCTSSLLQTDVINEEDERGNAGSSSSNSNV